MMLGVSTIEHLQERFILLFVLFFFDLLIYESFDVCVCLFGVIILINYRRSLRKP